MSIYPEIQRVESTDSSSFFVTGIERVIRHILPPNFFLGEGVARKLTERLPMISWSSIQEPPFEMTFYLLSHQRIDGFRFFQEMITSWLIPGKKIQTILQFAADFAFPSVTSIPLMAGQLNVRIESKGDVDILQKQLPIIEKEIRLGIASSYQASRILQIKGLSTDAKTALIQENLMAFIKRNPHHFDYDLFREMQHFLLLCQDEFKHKRNFRHISRIIAVHYFFRKMLTLSNEAYLNQRLIHMKLLRARVEGGRPIVGVIVALSFLHENERLEGRHIARAIRKIIRNVAMVEGSFVSTQYRSEKAYILYVEVEKKDRKHFSQEEFRLLHETLKDEIKAHIEESVNPIFMPENEEVILRNILVLSQQLTFVRDLPQVILTYKEQTGQKLEFLVVLVRVMKPTTIPISRFFELVQSQLKFFFDRSKKVGYVRKKYAKEANIFRIQIDKAPYVRQDGSIDLYKAQESVTAELRHILGDFRDYNGGYMSKERELFLALTKELGKAAQKHAFLLENFFYSFQPGSRRATLPLEGLKRLFNLLLKATKEGEGYSFHAHEEPSFSVLLLLGRDHSFKQFMLNGINSLKLTRDQWAYFFLKEGDHGYFGILLEKVSKEEVRQVRLILERQDILMS